MSGCGPGERIWKGAPVSGADPGPALSAEDRKLLEDIADWLARRRMATPAVFFLESLKPLNFVGSQALVFFEPVVRAFINAEGYARFAGIMERRENVETFLECIEAADHVQQARERGETKDGDA